MRAQKYCCSFILPVTILLIAIKSIAGVDLLNQYIKDHEDLLITDAIIASNVSTRSAVDCIARCVRASGWTCSYHDGDKKCNYYNKWVGGGEAFTSVPSPGTVIYSGKEL